MDPADRSFCPIPVNNSPFLTDMEAVFIVGVPRSGTTLLKSMLNMHPEVMIAPETHFFLEIWQHRGKHEGENNKERAKQVWQEYADTKFLDDIHNNQNILKKKIINSNFSYHRMYKILLTEYAQNNEAAICGDSTPAHLEYVDQLSQWFPQAQFVHIIRDPRAVSLSIRNTPWGADRSHTQNSFRWRKYVRKGNRLNEILTDNYHELQYETLVRKPRSTLQSLSNKIGIDFKPAMLRFHEQAAEHLSSDEPWKQSCRKPLQSESISRWKKELSHKEKSMISAVCREYMLKYNYSPTDICFADIPFMAQQFLSFGLRKIKQKITNLRAK